MAKVNLPVSISALARDDFNFILQAVKEIIPGIKFEEILGLVGRDYVAVFYVGKLTDPKVAKLITEIKRNLEKDDD